MDCGIPFCHDACPTHNLAPDWIAQVHKGNWADAIELLHATTNFPEFTGRVCPAPCEAACVKDLQNDAVDIHTIETAIIDRAWRAGRIRPQPARTHTRRHIAIVGSGPAGLACAQQLARAGHKIEVFEKNRKPGGLLRYGIPDFRLEKHLIDRRIAQMKTEGVMFRTNTHIGRDVSGPDLIGRFDATVLCCGSEHPRRLNVDGANLNGVHMAMDYLTQRNRQESGEWAQERQGERGAISAHGKHVAVVGGGQTGVDCVCTANREGAASVTQIDHNPSPDATVDRLLTWPQKRSRFFIAPCHEEDAACTRLWSTQTKALRGPNNNVGTLHYALVDIERHADGGRTLMERPKTEASLQTDLVLLALGFSHPVHTGLIEDLRLDLDAHGNVAASGRDFATSTPGVFACGDVRRGQSLVVWAIQEGRACAKAVDRYVMNSAHQILG